MGRPRTARRLVSIAASVAIFSMAPAGIAMASDNDHGGRDSESSSSSRGPGQGQLTDAQREAVNTARQAYFTSVQKIRSTFTTTIESGRAALKAELAPFDAARNAAQTAYVNAIKAHADRAVVADLKAKYAAASAAFRTALNSVKDKYQAQFDAAATAAKSALAAAATTYSNAITGAFAPQSPPRNLLAAPRFGDDWLSDRGQNYGWLLGHLHDSDDD